MNNSLFFVCKVNKRIYLAKHRNYNGFCKDVITQINAEGMSLEVGDIVSCVKNGTSKFNDSTINYWIPDCVVNNKRTMVVSSKMDDDGHMFTVDGELIDKNQDSMRAKPGESWEFAAVLIYDNRIIWSPVRRSTHIRTKIVEDGGQIFFVVSLVSGKKVFGEKRVEALRDYEITSNRNGKVKTIERFLFPIHNYDVIECGEFSVKTNEVPELAASFERISEGFIEIQGESNNGEFNLAGFYYNS